MAELTYGAHDFMAGALDELRELVERRRRGLHPVEVSGLVSTAALALRSTPEDNTRHEELIELPDGGTVRLVWQRAGRESYRSELGIVLILPGLNNSSHWPAIQQTARCFCQRGFDTAVLDYRGVGGLELTSAKVGCCDAWRDLPTVLSAVVRGAHPRAPVLAVGFSMGGTILLNHLSAEAATTPSTPLPST